MKNKSLIIFDVDNTLVDLGEHDYVWSLLSNYYKVTDQDKQFYKLWENGDISYDTWVKKDFNSYFQKGFSRVDLEKILSNTKLFDGTHKFLSELKNNDKKLGVVSGSINSLLEYHDLDMYFDRIHINKLGFSELGNYDESKVESTKYDMEGKINGVKEICDFYSINLNDCIYIGDGDNDVHVADFLNLNGGISISFNGTESLKKVSTYNHSGNYNTLIKVLL